jgi:hypothetical protein
MSEFRRAARDLLSTLDATDAYLNMVAVTRLFYSSVVRVEIEAVRLCEDILTELGVEEGLDVVVLEEATDELLAEAVNVGVSDQQIEIVGVDVEAAAEIDALETDAGAQEEELDLESSVADLDFEDVPSEELVIEEVPLVDLATEEAPQDAQVDGLEDLDLEDEVTGEVERDDVVAPTPEPSVPMDVIDPFDDDQDETMVMAMPTDEDGLSVLAAEATLEVPVDEEVVDTFDLMPDVSEDIDEEDLEVTSIRGLKELEELHHSVASDLEDDIDLLLDEDAEDETTAEPEPRDEDDGDVLSLAVGDPVAAVSAGVATARASVAPRVAATATAGLYGDPNVPTIREGREPKPVAAAIQLNPDGAAPKASQGVSSDVFEEDDEVLEIGGVEDYDDDYDEDDFDAGSGGGFALNVEEFDDDDDEYEDDEDEEMEVPQAPPVPVFTGPGKEEIAAMFAKAVGAADLGDIERGVDLFSDVIDADGENVQAHVGRGRLYLDLGDYSRAMSDFMVAEDIDEENPEPQIAIGDLYFARKDYRRAIDYFNAALDLSPNHAMAFCRRGISHYYRKNYPDGLADLTKAMELDSDIPNIGTYISMAKKKTRSRK